jgi:hypothetical protein
MRRLACAVGAVAVVFATALHSAPMVRLTFSEGRVSLTASGATAAQILAEWSRVGGTQIVNGDRIAGPPLMLELKDVTEVEALEIVLRNTGGFIATGRPSGPSAGAPPPSSVARITILPASTRPPITAPAADPQPEPQADPAPLPAPVLDASGARRIIGPDGQPVPDDQDGAPPPPESTPPR